MIVNDFQGYVEISYTRFEKFITSISGSKGNERQKHITYLKKMANMTKPAWITGDLETPAFSWDKFIIIKGQK